MTNIYRESTRNGWRLEFYLRGQRKKLWLGDMPKGMAEQLRGHIHNLKQAVELEIDPPQTTLLWAKQVKDRIHNKLAEWGLVEKRGETARTKKLSALCQEHIDRHPDWSDGARIWMERCRDQMLEFMGDPTLDKLTEWHAKQFHNGIQGRYAQATFAKQIQRAKQILKDGEGRFFARNPFEKIKVKSSVNVDRQEYVTKELVYSILEELTPQMQFVVAMARFAGVRVPSEVGALTWDDIDWKNSKITITASKQKRYVDKYKRVIPIFTELRPYLEAMPRTGETVLDWQGGKDLGQMFSKYLVQALNKLQIPRWERLWVTMRASCRTDLLRKPTPEHVVNAWLGHDGRIGAKHYNRVTDEDFKLAIAPTPTPTKTRNVKKSRGKQHSK